MTFEIGEIKRTKRSGPRTEPWGTPVSMVAFVTSRLDYCNSLLSGINKELLNRLESVLRSAARLVMRKRKFDLISEDIRNTLLHWLPVRQRIEFKLGILAFKCLSRRCLVLFGRVAVEGSGQSGSPSPQVCHPRWPLWCLELGQLKWARGVSVSRAQCFGTLFHSKFDITNKLWSRLRQN